MDWSLALLYPGWENFSCHRKRAFFAVLLLQLDERVHVHLWTQNLSSNQTDRNDYKINSYDCRNDYSDILAAKICICHGRSKWSFENMWLYSLYLFFAKATLWTEQALLVLQAGYFLVVWTCAKFSLLDVIHNCRWNK
jgi:hypothetical protein